MKKLLLFSTLLTAMSLQAQTTYYWPVERATELQSGTQYFIYNTTQSQGDRSWFIYSDGSALKTTNESPLSFITTENKYLFTTIKPESPKTDTHWYMKSAHGIVGMGGQTNNPEGTIRDIYITPWANDQNITRADVQSEAEDGTIKDPLETKVWSITERADANPNPADPSAGGNKAYAWNGNQASNNAWTTWTHAHPYAFYTVESKELSQEADEAYKALLGLANDTYNLQQGIGLIKDASQLSTNAQEQSEGPIENLIDNKENTFFHSSWQNDPTPEGTPHYLQVALNEPVKSFVFYSKKRIGTDWQGNPLNNDRPVEIRISVSMDGNDFTEIKTLTEADGLIAADDYTSPVISSDSEFKYVRFEVLKTNTSKKFFSYSEFYLFDAAQYEKVAAVKNYDLLKTETDENIQSTCNELYNVLGKSIFYKEIQTKLATIKAINWGTGLNQYTQPENYDQIIADAEALTIESSFEAIEASKNALENILATLTINQPEIGKYYRIKSLSNNLYIVSDATNHRQKLTSKADDANTVFYLSAGNRLTGVSLINLNHIGPSKDNSLGSSFTFGTHKLSGYMITSNGTDGNKAFMIHNDPNEGDVITTFWGDGNMDEVLRTAWALEEVTDGAQQFQMNKTMSSEYATIAAPVALNIPAGVKAYTVTVDEAKETAILEEVTDIIPAGVAVVLKKENAADNFSFTFAAEGTTSNANSLVGVYADTEIGSDINAYILGNGTQGIGFYQMNANDRTLGANKAYLALPASMSGVRSITIGGPTTGIEDTVTEGAQAEEYYDLQGRRVMNPTKGIYVTKSGKKVIFNK